MVRLRPGWLVALCAAVLAVSVWLPWLTSRADGGGRANAIGGIVGNMPVPPPGFGVGQLITLLASTLIVAGAMAARGLFGRLASTAALAISVLLVVLTMWYYRLYVYSPVSAGYGLYIGAAAAVLAVVLSVWAMVAAWSAVSRRFMSGFVEPVTLTGQRWVTLEPLAREHVPEIAEAAQPTASWAACGSPMRRTPEAAAQWVDMRLASQKPDRG